MAQRSAGFLYLATVKLRIVPSAVIDFHIKPEKQQRNIRKHMRFSAYRASYATAVHCCKQSAAGMGNGDRSRGRVQIFYLKSYSAAAESGSGVGVVNTSR